MGSRSKQQDHGQLVADPKHPGSKMRIGHKGGSSGSGPAWMWHPAGCLVRVMSPRKQMLEDRRVKAQVEAHKEAVEREKQLRVKVDTKPYVAPKKTMFSQMRRVFQRKAK